MTQILIVAVNYMAEEETMRFVEQLQLQTIKDKISIVIVDNKKSENAKIDLKLQLEQLDIDCEYIFPDQNLGYLNGCLYGLEEYIKKQSIPRWVVISNTDIDISDTMLFEKFINTAYTDDTYVVAPALKNLNGSYHNPYYKERVTLKKINRIIRIKSIRFLSRIYTKLASVKKARSVDKQESQYVYAAHGSFFIVRDKLFEFMRGEKYGALLYGEENFIAEMVLEAGAKCFYDENLELVHTENIATRMLDDAKRREYVVNALTYIKSRFYTKK